MSEADNAVRELVLDATGIRPLGPGASRVWRYLHDQEHTEIFTGGSAGPGKTFNGCLFDVTESLRLKGSAGLMFRSTAENLRKSTIVTYFEVCQKARLVDGLHYKFNESKGFLQWIGGSVTSFDYLTYMARDPNYSRLGGRQYTRAVGDEIDEVEERGVDVLMGRIRYKLTHWCHNCAAEYMAIRSTPVDCDEETGDPIMWECYVCGIWTKGILPKLLGTGNPGDYWTKYRFVVKENGDLRRKTAIGWDKSGEENCWVVEQSELQPHQACVLMLLADNPDKGFVTTTQRQLESNPDDFDKERLLKGNWMAVRKTGREFLHAFRSQDHVWGGTRRVGYHPALPLHITFDFNTAPYMTLLIAQLKLQPDGRWHVAFLQEICLKHPESTTEATCKAFAREMTDGRYAGHDAGVFYYGDATGKAKDTLATYHNYDVVEKVLTKWRSAAWDRVLRSNPPHTIVRDYYNSVLRGERKHYVTFDPSMSNTIADILNVKEAADGTILKQTEKDHDTGVTSEKYGHCLQASYYLTCSAFSEEFATFIRR